MCLPDSLVGSTLMVVVGLRPEWARTPAGPSPVKKSEGWIYIVSVRILEYPFVLWAKHPRTC